jgi:hypothetical protein
MVIAAVSSMVLSIWLLRGLRAAASDRINARVTHSLQERAARRTEIGEPRERAADEARLLRTPRRTRSRPNPDRLALCRVEVFRLAWYDRNPRPAGVSGVRRGP